MSLVREILSANRRRLNRKSSKMKKKRGSLLREKLRSSDKNRLNSTARNKRNLNNSDLPSNNAALRLNNEKRKQN